MAGWSPPPLPAQWTWTADRAPWVGRLGELAEVERSWAAVEHGARQVVLVAGEPGAGKSRLVMEASSGLHARGVPVLVGQCTSDLGLPFDPLVVPIRSLLTAVETGELELHSDPGVPTREAQRLLALLTSGVTPEDATQLNLEVLALRAVLAALAGACALGPVVMVLEDLHWAGESGLRVLRHIVERTADLPLLVLATYRDVPPDATDALGELETDLLRLTGTRRIHIGGLQNAEIVAYLTAVGPGADGQVERAAPLLHERTGGNPFLLGEVWREIRDHGGLDRVVSGRLAVPGSLQAMVRRRLSRLGTLARAEVGLGAVIGESFDVALVRAAAPGPETPEDDYQALSDAVRQGLIHAVGESPGRYRFPHALARQAVLEEMEPFALASAHAAVGSALERGGAARDPDQLVRLAHHFSMAVGLGLESTAVRYLEQAAAVATTRLAHSDAAELLARAADIALEGDQRARLTLEAATSYVRAGHLDRAQTLNERVATSDQAAFRLQAAVGYESATWPTGVGATRSSQLLRAALADSTIEDTDPQRIVATAAYGRALFYAGRHDDAEEVIDRALALARSTGDPALLLSVLATGLTGVSNIRMPRGVGWLLRHQDRAGEAADLAKALHDLRQLGNASQVRAYAAYIFGDLAELDRALADLLRVGRETQEPFWVWRELIVSAARYMMRCDFTEAETRLADSSRMAFSFGHQQGQLDAPLSVTIFALRRETGRLEFARRLLAAGTVPLRVWGPGLTALYGELGMREQAATTLHETLSESLEGLRESVTWPASLALLGETAVDLADRAAAEILLAEAEPFAGLNLMAPELLATFGSADRLLAGLKSVLGRPGVADHFSAALEMDARMASPLHVATTHAEWARWLRRTHASTQVVDRHVALARELADRDRKSVV